MFIDFYFDHLVDSVTNALSIREGIFLPRRNRRLAQETVEALQNVLYDTGSFLFCTFLTLYFYL